MSTNFDVPLMSDLNEGRSDVLLHLRKRPEARLFAKLALKDLADSLGGFVYLVNDFLLIRAVPLESDHSTFNFDFLVPICKEIESEYTAVSGAYFTEISSYLLATAALRENLVVQKLILSEKHVAHLGANLQTIIDVLCKKEFSQEFKEWERNNEH